VALTLGELAAANELVSDIDCADPRGPEHVRAKVQAAAGAFAAQPRDMPGVMRRLMSDVGLPSTLREAGVPLAALPSLAQSIDPVRSGNNPRRLDRSQVEAMLLASFGAEDQASADVIVTLPKAQEPAT
jgi:alcohol dehydrogenase class IV